MTLTSITFISSAIGGTTATKNTLGAWAYRVDNGAGYGAWTLNEFALPSGPLKQTLTFAEEVVVTEKIQFGFFTAGATTDGGRIQVAGSGVGDDLFVSGNVTAVPEPSTYALIGLGGIALWAFKRRQKSSAVTTA